MQLYTFPLSSNSRKAQMAAILLQVPVELKLVNLAKGEQRAPEYLAKNPMGKVPLLVDGDVTLSESDAILRYLAAGVEDTPLYPTDRKRRAVVDQWLAWASNHWSPATGALNLENMLKPRFGMGETDPVQVERQNEYLRQFAQVLDQHLGKQGGGWICGKELTLADISIGASLMYMKIAKYPIEDFANVMAWFGRLQALPAWKQTEPPPMPGAAS